MSNIFLDTETTGLDPDGHPIWEVAAVLDSGGEYVWQLPLTGRELALAHPKALEIGHFHERYDPANTTDLWQFCSEFEKLTNGAHLCGAVVSFDEERLRRLLWREGFNPGWHYHLCDVENLAVGWLAGQGTIVHPPWNSDDLSRAVGVDPEEFERHSALGDVLWAKAIYEKVMGC